MSWSAAPKVSSPAHTYLNGKFIYLPTPYAPGDPPLPPPSLKWLAPETHSSLLLFHQKQSFPNLTGWWDRAGVRIGWRGRWIKSQYIWQSHLASNCWLHRCFEEEFGPAELRWKVFIQPCLWQAFDWQSLRGMPFNHNDLTPMSAALWKGHAIALMSHLISWANSGVKLPNKLWQSRVERADVRRPS